MAELKFVGLGNSKNSHYGMCSGRPKPVVRRLWNSGGLLEKCMKTFQEQKHLDITEEVTEEMDDRRIIHYIFNQKAVTHQKTATKLRVVLMFQHGLKTTTVLTMYCIEVLLFCQN